MTAPGTALVIGGSGALGSAIVTRLHERGHPVVATFASARPAAGPDAVTWIRFVVPEDDAQPIATVLAAAEQALTTVVFAVGAPSSKQTLVNTGAAESARLFTVNALALVTVWQAIYRAARAGAARVLVVSSQAAAAPSPRNGPYSASKAALEAFALTLAKEEAEYGVRVNVLSPSIIASPQAEHVIALKGETDATAYYKRLPWRRALSLAEVADTAVSVACDEGWRYASGQILRLSADVLPHKELM